MNLFLPLMNWRIWLAISLAIVSLSVSWIGYQGSPDEIGYIQAAVGWLENPPFLGQNHWQLRLPYVFSLSLSFLFFGINEQALLSVTVLFFLLIIFVSYHFTASIYSADVAGIIACFLAITPLFVGYATTSFPLHIELFFIILSFWLFYQAIEKDACRNRLIASGAVAALAWVTRETSGFLPVFYALLFLIGFGMKRRYYFLLAAGFLPIVLSEYLLHWLVAGDPLHRHKISLGIMAGGTKESITEFGQAYVQRATHFKDVITTKLSYNVIHVSPAWLNPYVAWFTDPHFGLLYYVGIPSGLWLCFSKKVSSKVQTLARILALLAIVHFIMTFYVLILRPSVRYMAVETYALTMLTSIWFYEVIIKQRQKLTIPIIAVIFVVNFLCMDARRERGQFPERTLLEYAQQQQEIIHSDPITVQSAQFLLHGAGLESRVSSAPVPPGGIFFYNPQTIRSIKNSKVRDSFMVKGPNWTPLWFKDSRASVLGLILDGSGLGNLLPAGLMRKLLQPHERVTVYRLPGQE
jgi:4-amino-4-deoxy-L-arabinose transferase-like glycosyltransferase